MKDLLKEMPLGMKVLVGFILVLMTLSLGIQYKVEAEQDAFRQMAFEIFDGIDAKDGKSALYIEIDEALLKGETENAIIKHAVEKGWVPTYKGQTGMAFAKVK